MSNLTKESILSALHQRIAEGKPIIVTAAGAGLIARLEEKSGADMIVVYNSGRYRMNGIASIAGNLPIGDANQIVYEMGRDQILPMVKHTPVIAGIYGVDPTRDMRKFLLSLKELGYSAVINFPTIGKISGPIRQELEQVGLGFAKEVSSLKLASELGFVTLAYCYNPEEAEILAENGIDIIVSHVGLTAGGDVGVKTVSPLQQAIEKTEAILSAAKRVKPDIIPLCHGGPIVTPEDVKQVLHSTCAVGFVAASSIERLPIEHAVTDTVEQLKSVND
ncbi:MAG: phosphoenolpyruvate hydrolase family protein [Clostridia bacterium]|nr:phosphoenolpyruvate hydrolase family protein [Clostridia bacterium]